jgi:nucleoside-diphosphate-sugar epimerase
MKVFVAGATGAVGRRLVPLLVDRGHEVVATTRSAAKRDALRAVGAEPVVVVGLDRRGVVSAVLGAEPDVVVHQMTALAGVTSLRNFDRAFATTNRLRTEGTDNLMEGAALAGARRFVAQSFGNWNYWRSGSAAKREHEPFDPQPPAHQRESLAAIRHVERVTLTAQAVDGVVLRYANLYGPGTGFAEDGYVAAMVRGRRLPIVGDGAGVWSFIHVDDAAAATLAAIERGAPGIYNIADDQPVAVADWLPEFAQALGAKPPRRVPVSLGWLASGEVGVSMMTRIRGASNAKAKRELGWEPGYATIRQGFHAGLGGVPAPLAW